MRASEVLRELASDGRNLVGSSSDIAGVLQHYATWVEGTEAQLASLTLDPDAVTMLLTPRHWQILDTGPNPLRAWPALRSEINFQVASLEALARDIDDRIARADGARGEPVVLDTNTLLHYQRPDSVRWPSVVGRTPVRLVVPLRVVEELDAKKYARNDLAQRARGLLPWLEATVADGSGQAGESTTIEVPVDPTRRSRPQDADREILDTCEELRDFGGQRVMLVTGDTGMRLRARAAGISTISMPDTYLRSVPDRMAPA